MSDSLYLNLNDINYFNDYDGEKKNLKKIIIILTTRTKKYIYIYIERERER